MSHKVYIGVLHENDMTAGDRCVMMMFPKNDFRCHIIVTPALVEARNIGELRTKIIAEIDAKLGYLPGMAQAAAILDKINPAIQAQPMTCLTVEGSGPTASPMTFLAVEGCNPTGTIYPEKKDCYIDLEAP